MDLGQARVEDAVFRQRLLHTGPIHVTVGDGEVLLYRDEHTAIVVGPASPTADVFHWRDEPGFPYKTRPPSQVNYRLHIHQAEVLIYDVDDNDAVLLQGQRVDQDD